MIGFVTLIKLCILEKPGDNRVGLYINHGNVLKSVTSRVQKTGVIVKFKNMSYCDNRPSMCKEIQSGIMTSSSFESIYHFFNISTTQ